MKHLLLMGLMLATAQLAQVWAQYFQEGLPYTFSGTAASGTGNMSYQWYRNGVPIEGATEANYVLRDELAYGTNIEFKRRVISSACPYKTAFTNIVTVTFYSPLIINGVHWAPVNVDEYQTFAYRPDMHTKRYQWNRQKAYESTAAIPSQSITDSAWTINPCPDGWRLPTQAEFQALLATCGNSTSDVTSASTNKRGASIEGSFIGPNREACSLPINNTASCIFLPWLNEQNQDVGYYWTSTQYSSTQGYALIAFWDGGVSYRVKNFGMNIRCVQDMQ